MKQLLFFASAIILALDPSRRTPNPSVTAPNCKGSITPIRSSISAFSSQGQSLDMAFMDVKPNTPNGETAVLLHGKNFCAATWEATIKALVDAGYRVVAPGSDRLLQVEQTACLSIHVPATRREHPRAFEIARR